MAAEATPAASRGGVARVTLACLLSVAVLLRVAAIDKPFYIDEVTTLTVASQPIGQMGRVMRLIDATPVLYPALLHAWISVSHAQIWVRLLSALFGCAAVIALWRLVRSVFGPRAGLAALGVMAIAPAYVQYAQYVRNYSLFTLLAVLHAWTVLDWMRPGASRSPARAAAVVTVATALLYTHYLSLLLLATTGLFVVWKAPRMFAAARGWVLCLATAGALFLPGLPLLLHNVEFDRIRNEERPEPPPFGELAPTLIAEIGVGPRALGFDDTGVRRATLMTAAVLLPGLALVGLVRGWRTNRDAAVLFALLSVVPLSIYLGSGRRLVAVRFFLPFMVGYVALIGMGLSTLRRWQAALAGAAVVALSAIPLAHFYRHYSWSYDHRAVTRAIEDLAEPGDAVFFVHPFESLYYRWYLDDRLPLKGLMFTALEEQQTYVIKPPPFDVAYARDRVRELSRPYRRFWIVGQSTKSFASDAAGEQQLFDWIESRYAAVANLDRLTGGDPRVRLYDARAVSPAAPSR